MKRDLETFASGTARAVDVAAIERELVALWGEAAETDPSVTRASLFNLVVRAGGATREGEASASVARVAAELPCRALVVVEDAPAPAGAAALAAMISAHCTRAGKDRRQVCCEQVTLRATPQARASLPSTILALLLADLPMALWWPGDVDFEGPLLGGLGRHVDRLLVDSATWRDGPAALVALAGWRRAHARADVVDLAWSRLDAWRESAAGFFDAPPFSDHLAALRDVEVGGATIVSACLLAGWLASRLGWTAPRRAGRGWTWRDARGASVELACVDGERLRLGAADGTSFHVERQGSQLVARVERAATCPLPRRLAVGARARDDELVRALARTRRQNAGAAAADAAAILAAGLP